MLSFLEWIRSKTTGPYLYRSIRSKHRLICSKSSGLAWARLGDWGPKCRKMLVCCPSPDKGTGKGLLSSDCVAASRTSDNLVAGTIRLAQTQRAMAAGVKGATPCRRRHFREEPWHTTGVRFGEPALRTRRPLRNPRVFLGEHATRCPHLDTCSLRRCPTARPPAGKGALPLCTPHRGKPLDPGWVAECRAAIQRTHASCSTHLGLRRRRGYFFFRITTWVAVGVAVCSAHS